MMNSQNPTVTDPRPTTFDVTGSDGYFNVCRRARAGELKVHNVFVLGNCEWRFQVSYRNPVPAQEGQP